MRHDRALDPRQTRLAPSRAAAHPRDPQRMIQPGAYAVHGRGEADRDEQGFVTAQDAGRHVTVEDE
jgi:hypothetical protein